MSNFWARTITGLSMVFILLAGLYFNEWIFALLFFVVAVLGVREFYSLIASEQFHPQKLYGTISSAILYAILIVNHYRPLSLNYFNLLYIPALLKCLHMLFPIGSRFLTRFHANPPLIFRGRLCRVTVATGMWA